MPRLNVELTDEESEILESVIWNAIAGQFDDLAGCSRPQVRDLLSLGKKLGVHWKDVAKQDATDHELNRMRDFFGGSMPD